MSLRPFGNRLLIEPDEPVSASRGGIVIPETAKKASSRGTVLAVGLGDYDQVDTPIGELTWPNGTPVVPKAGDRILFSKYGGTDVREGDKDLLILHVKDILCIIEDEEIII